LRRPRSGRLEASATDTVWCPPFETRPAGAPQGEVESENRGVHEIGHEVEAPRVPGIGDAVVGDVGEGHARIRVGPAIRRADATMAEDTRRGEGAEAADGLGIAAHVRADA